MEGELTFTTITHSTIGLALLIKEENKKPYITTRYKSSNDLSAQGNAYEQRVREIQTKILLILLSTMLGSINIK